MNEKTMLSRDAISAKAGRGYAVIDGERFNLINAINITAEYEKQKAEINTLGKMATGHKTVGISYSGSATFEYNSSMYRKYLYRYKETGEDLYFDLQLVNDDPDSAAGRQTIILKGVNLDSGILAQMDGEGDVLTEEISFTFEDWEMPEEFKELDGMRG